MLAPSLSTRRRPGWSVVLVAILLLVSGLPALARATPVASPAGGQTRLYVGHDTRLTAEIPATWKPDWTLRAEYRGTDGFILTQSLWVDIDTVDSVEAQCDIVAGAPEFDHAGEVTRADWRGQPACRIALPGGDAMSRAGAVFAHPDPAPDGHNRYVVVIADAGHIDAILDSIAFDPALVTPRAYLDAALDVIEMRWLWRDDIDWDQLRDDALAAAGDISTTDDLAATYPALDLVIRTLVDTGPDKYASFAPPQVMAGASPDTRYVAPIGQALPGGIGYLVAPGLTVPGEETRYADDMHTIIDAQRDAATCGWVLDLRDNPGGNMYPMLGGLTPLLQPGALVGFRDAAGGTVQVDLRDDGVIVYDGQPMTWLSPWFARPDPALAAQPVAIIVDDQTAGSAEDVAVAFRDQPGTRVFGERTYGLTTSPWVMWLYDGAFMAFTEAWVTGPLGATYPDGLQPDVTEGTTFTAPDPADDHAVQTAIAWLTTQPGCSGAVATPES